MNYDRPIMYKTLDLCLTPRFWKGQLVYDGRKPLTVYRNEIYASNCSFVINQQKSYPPEWTRSLDPGDGLIFSLSNIRNIKGGKGVKMLICVTMYNQPVQFLQRTLIGVWKNLRKLVKERGLSAREVAVVVLQDGIMKLIKDPTGPEYSSSVSFWQKLDYEAGKTSCTLVDRMGTIRQQIQNYQRKEMAEFVRKNNDLPPSIPKNISLLYQMEWRPNKAANAEFNLDIDYETDPFLQLFGCFKHLNAKKLSSHLWFFEGFCRLLTPEYCALIDVGTEPAEYGVISFLNAMENDPNIGGVSGFMSLDIGLRSTEAQIKNEYVAVEEEEVKFDLEECCYPAPILSTIGVVFLLVMDRVFSCLSTFTGIFLYLHECFSVQRAQLFQYNYSHMLDKNFESFFGYLNVLPGAWSAYRYKAICMGNRYQQNLLEKKYLKIVLDPNFTERDYKQANMYLAEDRILCLGIYCQKDAKYYLKYVPEAEAKTDPMDDLLDLMIQRRRWINSSYFAFDYVYRNYAYNVRDSIHPWQSQNIFLPLLMLMSKINLINTYLTPALFFFALYTSMFETYKQVVKPVYNSVGTIIESGWVVVPALLCFGYVIVVATMIGICINKRAREARNMFVITSAILGFYYLLLICIVVFYIVLNYFTPDSEALLNPTNRSIRDLIKWLTVTNFISLSVPVIMHLPTHPKRVLEMLDPRTLISYLYYQAVYSHTLVIYAFCNIDDVTWGTKGIKEGELNAKSYFDDKIAFVSDWIFWNTILAFILIFFNIVFENEVRFSIMLISAGAYSTLMVFLKFLFAICYHLYECASKSWIKRLYYSERERQKIETEFNKLPKHEIQMVPRRKTKNITTPGNNNNNNNQNMAPASNVRPGMSSFPVAPGSSQKEQVEPFTLSMNNTKFVDPFTLHSHPRVTSPTHRNNNSSNLASRLFNRNVHNNVQIIDEEDIYTQRALNLEESSKIHEPKEPLPTVSLRVNNNNDEEDNAVEPKPIRIKTRIYNN